MTPNNRAVSCCAARTISAAQLSSVCRCSRNVQPSPGLYTAQTVHIPAFRLPQATSRTQQGQDNMVHSRLLYNCQPDCMTTFRQKIKYYIYVVLWFSPLQSHSIPHILVTPTSDTTVINFKHDRHI